jgi:hypothetical protein
MMPETKKRLSSVIDNAERIMKTSDEKTIARAKALLSRLGTPGSLRPDDDLNAPDETD